MVHRHRTMLDRAVAIADPVGAIPDREATSADRGLAMARSCAREDGSRRRGPASRGRGVGKLALAIVEQKARNAGVHALHLLVDPVNDRAVRLYQSSGFANSHRKPMTKVFS